MNILYIDIASHDGMIACGTPQEIVAKKECSTRIRDDELIPLIEELLQEANWEYSDLTHIACVLGPGGFTSLRIAVTCANVLADQLQIPCAGIHLKDVYLARAKNSTDVFWVHSTKRTEVFVCGGQWKEPTHLSLEALLVDVSKDMRWVGELLPEHEEALDLQHADTVPVDQILPTFLSSLQYEEKILLPWYGRKG